MRPKSADLILLNTCHIREKAAEKVYSELGRLRALKDAAPRRKAGGDDRRRRLRRPGRGRGDHAPRAGGRPRRRPAVLSPPAGADRAAPRRGGRVVATDFAVEEKFDALDRLPAAAPAAAARAPSRAFLTVQEGCDKFCTFCVVPYTRGAEVSRPVAAIVAEAARLAGEGVREVTLLGQNVNAWHGEGPDGTRLGPRPAALPARRNPGLDRLRYTTSHPRDMDDDLIAAHRDLPALMPYLHLPVQSGSDRILAAMNRRAHRATTTSASSTASAPRGPTSRSPATSSSASPARPTPTSRDTLRLVDEVGYASAFSFKYSPRPGTPAARDGPGAGGGEGRAARPAAGADRRAARRAFNRVARRHDVAECCSSGRAASPGQIVGRSP